MTMTILATAMAMAAFPMGLWYLGFVKRAERGEVDW